jgi:hypothetical protein
VTPVEECNTFDGQNWWFPRVSKPQLHDSRRNMGSILARAAPEDTSEMSPCGITASNNPFEYCQERQIYNFRVVILLSIKRDKLNSESRDSTKRTYRENSTTSAQV